MPLYLHDGGTGVPKTCSSVSRLPPQVSFRPPVLPLFLFPLMNPGFPGEGLGLSLSESHLS